MMMSNWCLALYIYISFCLLPVVRSPPYPSTLHLAYILLAFCFLPTPYPSKLSFACCQLCALRPYTSTSCAPRLIHLQRARLALYIYIAFCSHSTYILLFASCAHPVSIDHTSLTNILKVRVYLYILNFISQLYSSKYISSTPLLDFTSLTGFLIVPLFYNLLSGNSARW